MPVRQEETSTSHRHRVSGYVNFSRHAVYAARGPRKCYPNTTLYDSTGAPKLAGSGRSFSSAAMVSALWHHGPQMLEQMKAKGIAWPRLDGPEMANLIAYLNGRK